MPQRPRPLSPFMNYRWLYTNTLSILHRITGVLLSIAFLLFVYWLTAAAAGLKDYAVAVERLDSPLGQVVLAGAVLAFVYHLLNGIRQLFFDAGVGFERPTARRSGWSVAIGSIVLTLVVCWLLWSRLGAGS
jgi:succinate dehydrogenase / fumarate reductase cytochrome b subunit